MIDYTKPCYLLDPLPHGAPAKLHATDAQAPLWQVFDSDDELIPLVQSYDTAAGELVVCARDHKGRVALDALTGDVVTYRRLGGFKIRHKGTHPPVAIREELFSKPDTDEKFVDDPNLSELLVEARDCGVPFQ